MYGSMAQDYTVYGGLEVDVSALSNPAAIYGGGKKTASTVSSRLRGLFTDPSGSQSMSKIYTIGPPNKSKRIKKTKNGRAEEDNVAAMMPNDTYAGGYADAITDSGAYAGDIIGALDDIDNYKSTLDDIDAVGAADSAENFNMLDAIDRGDILREESDSADRKYIERENAIDTEMVGAGEVLYTGDTPASLFDIDGVNFSLEDIDQ